MEFPEQCWKNMVLWCGMLISWSEVKTTDWYIILYSTATNSSFYGVNNPIAEAEFSGSYWMENSIFMACQKSFHICLILHLADRWKTFREMMIEKWIISHRIWLNDYKGPLHIVRYERLQSHLVDEMRTLMNFLGWNITDSQLDCVVQNSEGKFHRENRISTIDPWAGFHQHELDTIMRKIDNWPYCGQIWLQSEGQHTLSK